MFNFFNERLNWIGETLLGIALMLLPLINKIIDDITLLAHLVVAVGGAIITVLGVKRALRHELRNRHQVAIAREHLASKGKLP